MFRMSIPAFFMILHALVPIWPTNSSAQFLPGDPVIYSRYYIMMTDLDEVSIMIVEKVRHSMVVLRDHEGNRLSTHSTSLQPIFNLDRIRTDRTIQTLQSLFHLDSSASFRITSRDLAGPVHGSTEDSMYYSGQEYRLIVSTDSLIWDLALIDTFIYKNPGLTLQGINDGKPDYYILQFRGARQIDTAWQTNPIFLECFYKIDALKLLKDEQLNISR